MLSTLIYLLLLHFFFLFLFFSFQSHILFPSSLRDLRALILSDKMKYKSYAAKRLLEDYKPHLEREHHDFYQYEIIQALITALSKLYSFVLFTLSFKFLFFILLSFFYFLFFYIFFYLFLYIYMLLTNIIILKGMMQ